MFYLLITMIYFRFEDGSESVEESHSSDSEDGSTADSQVGGSQFTRCIPLSKREAKIRNQAGLFVFDKFTLQVNLCDKWSRVN